MQNEDISQFQTPSTDRRRRSNSNGNTEATSKQAACLACRRIKTKCNRDPTASICKRCDQMNIECVIPAFRVGRYRGTKNKRKGLEKAVHQIEQAIEESKINDGQIENEQTAHQLQELLDKTRNLLPQRTITSYRLPTKLSVNSGFDDENSVIDADFSPRNQDGSSILDDAENPLQLLARASDNPISPVLQSGASDNTSRGSMSSRQDFVVHSAQDPDLQAFFGPLAPHTHLDIGEDIDPIDMGYITPSEADTLFTYFYQSLSHTRWGLDPLVHTVSFVRSRSAFLFTSILAASSRFLTATAALSKRLSVHCKNLADFVIKNRVRSTEIVLAFMVNIPWMAPGKHWADDATCTYMAMALTTALDISLNKVIVPSPSDPHALNPKHLIKSDCISARRALSLDGFDDVDATSPWGRRLLRRRERIWLALFVLDRGVCLARGRSSSVPTTPLVQTCDNWHISDMQDMWDGSIISSAVLRRDLVTLIANIKSTCDGASNLSVDGTTVAQSIKDMIESFYDHWYCTWAVVIEGGKPHHLPPYVDILVSHTKLSTYSSVINHPTAPYEVKRFFHAAGLSSSLNVMRASVQGEGQLKSMPNNTAIMISFAACFALSLISVAADNNLRLAPSIRILIYETADVLERIGTIPMHRNGMSAFYGRHLRDVVRISTERLNKQQLQQPVPPSQINTHSLLQDPFNGIRGRSSVAGSSGNENIVSPFEPMLLSAMSDHQIAEAIQNAGDELDTLPNFQTDDLTGLDWLDWFSMDIME